MRNYQKSAEDLYWTQLFAHEDSLLREIRVESETRDHGGMQISPLEGRLLQTWMRAARVEKVVEIGSFMGYSAIWLARALPAWGSLICIEKDAAHAQLTIHNLGRALLDANVSVIQGDALDMLKTVEPRGPFDMVFIDANKFGYMDYLLWAEDNVRVGGLIVGDNTRLFGTQHLPHPTNEVSAKSWQAMRQFNERLAHSERYTSVLVPTAEGMTVAVKNF
jgi:predicted O-methyltransferase YrrM